MTSRWRLFLFFGFIVPFAFNVEAIHSQQPAPDPMTSQGVSSFKTAANQWQLTVGDEAAAGDTASPAVRAARNAYWADVVRQFVPPPNAITGVGVSDGSYLSSAPEIDPTLGSTFVVARFQSFKVFDAQPGESLPYTEMYFQVTSLVNVPSQVPIKVGTIVPIDIAGGRLKLPTGQARTILVSPRKYFFQVGHTYLVQLVPSVAGTYSASKRWDVTTGVIMPDMSQEVVRSQHGNAVLQGRTVADVSSFIQGALEAKHGN